MSLLRDLARFVAPPICPACGRRLYGNVHGVCAACWQSLGRVPYDNEPEHGHIERFFWGRLPVGHATAMFYYDDDVRAIVHDMKFHAHPELGYHLSRAWAQEMAGTDFFHGVECIVPLPLHPLRKMARGYNQSTYIARGLSSVTSLPVLKDVVVRRGRLRQQARLSRLDRWENVEGRFRLVRPERIAGRHVLLVDDVFTTGSTLLACAQQLALAPSVTVSVLAFAYANRRILQVPQQAGGE